MSLRVCLLTDETIETFNPSIYLTEYEWDLITVQHPVFDFIHDLSSRRQYDVYLNLFEGFDADENSGLDLIKTLETLHLAFTGAHANCYNPTREEMQQAAERNGLRFARGFQAKFEQDLSQAQSLSFPLIVKHPNSFASIGLTRDSRVDSFEQLTEQFKRVYELYGAARVEEFIDGEEVSCLVVDNPDDFLSPFAYLPSQVSFPAGETFLHEEVKWFNWDTYVKPMTNKELIPEIQDISKKMYLAMRVTGYARIDIRVRPSKEAVILEINPNCGILYGPEDRSHADLPISWDKDGHKGFLGRIFRAAILRHKMSAS